VVQEREKIHFLKRRMNEMPKVSLAFHNFPHGECDLFPFSALSVSCGASEEKHQSITMLLLRRLLLADHPAASVLMRRSTAAGFTALLVCSSASAFVILPQQQQQHQQPKIQQHHADDPSLTSSSPSTIRQRRRETLLSQATSNNKQEPRTTTMTIRERFRNWVSRLGRMKRPIWKRKDLVPPPSDIVADETTPSELYPERSPPINSTDTADHHHHQRWAVSANSTDLTGVWKPIVTPQFKQEYDEYLQKCGEGVIFRRALLGAIGFYKEVVQQEGSELSITGTAPIGGWKRVLVASGYQNEDDHEPFEPVYSTFRDPDGDTVSVESWWQDNGRIHKSILRGKPRVKGGEFETTRYLEDGDNNVLVCEAVFHPPPNNDNGRFQPARVQWRFQREE